MVLIWSRGFKARRAVSKHWIGLASALSVSPRNQGQHPASPATKSCRHWLPAPLFSLLFWGGRLGYLSSVFPLLTPISVVGFLLRDITCACFHGCALPLSSETRVTWLTPLIASWVSGLPSGPLRPPSSGWSCVVGPQVLTLPLPH